SSTHIRRSCSPPMRLAILVAYLILAVAANRAAAGCNGLLLGTTDYNGSGNSIDRAWSVLVDSSGNVVVAGDEAGIVGGANWRVRRYDPTLTSLLSSTDYDGPGNSSDIPSSVVLDGSGNLLVAGFETGSTGGRNWRIRRYDPTLTALLSTTDYSSPGNNSDYAYSMAVEGNGDVVVAVL